MLVKILCADVARAAQAPAHPAPKNDYDHEREGARTSGVTDLIVVAPATEPFSCNIAVRINV